MKGVVLGYDTEAEAVVLRAEDGRRYRFPLSEWRDRQAPRKGDEVDFESDGVRALEIYVVAPARHLDAATVTPLSIVSGWAPARFFLTRPVLTCAVLVLLACFFGAYSLGDVRITLFQVPELISRMSEALDSLIAASGADPAPRIGAGVARILLILLLGLYVVPVLAVITIWREFLGRPDRRLAVAAAVAAIVLPIGLPLIVSLVVQTWVIPGIPDLGTRLGRTGVTTPQQVFEVLRLYATGTILLIFAGLALWAAAADRLSVSAGTRAAPEATEPIKPKPRSRPDLFAPLRARRSTPRKAKAAPAPQPAESRAPGSPAPVPQRAGPAAPAAARKERVPFLKLGRRAKTPAPASAPPAAHPAVAADAPQPQSPPPPSAPPPSVPPAADPRYAEGLDEALRAARAARPPEFLQVPRAAGDASETDNPAPDVPQTPKPEPAAQESGVDLPPRTGSVWPQPAADAPSPDPGRPAPAPSTTGRSPGDA
ncbi:hypothetical protein [Microbaculum marinum]|uniref:Uncharacterized protein n=1 Tax=Microbaculum marinum TaxID=1764581 RepID=A0AAW9RL11_9HYPH